MASRSIDGDKGYPIVGCEGEMWVPLHSTYWKYTTFLSRPESRALSIHRFRKDKLHLNTSRSSEGNTERSVLHQKEAWLGRFQGCPGYRVLVLEVLYNATPGGGKVDREGDSLHVCSLHISCFPKISCNEHVMCL